MLSRKVKEAALLSALRLEAGQDIYIKLTISGPAFCFKIIEESEKFHLKNEEEKLDLSISELLRSPYYRFEKKGNLICGQFCNKCLLRGLKCADMLGQSFFTILDYLKKHKMISDEVYNFINTELSEEIKMGDFEDE